jgi:hypothetical protein
MWQWSVEGGSGTLLMSKMTRTEYIDEQLLTALMNNSRSMNQ